MKRVLWVVVALVVGAGVGAWAQAVDRWQHAPEYLDPSTMMDVVRDRVSQKCFAVYIVETEDAFGMVPVGEVPCGSLK